MTLRALCYLLERTPLLVTQPLPKSRSFFWIVHWYKTCRFQLPLPVSHSSTALGLLLIVPVATFRAPMLVSAVTSRPGANDTLAVSLQSHLSFALWTHDSACCQLPGNEAKTL